MLTPGTDSNRVDRQFPGWPHAGDCRTCGPRIETVGEQGRHNVSFEVSLFRFADVPVNSVIASRIPGPPCCRAPWTDLAPPVRCAWDSAGGWLDGKELSTRDLAGALVQVVGGPDRHHTDNRYRR